MRDLPGELSISDLSSEVKGTVLAPDDPGYDQARRVVAGDVDRRPAVIVRAANPADVVRVIALARETGLPLAVRSGGHSGAGHGVCEGGIVLDLRDLNSIEIDATARTAWVETGVTAGEFTAAAGEHGLATGFGDTGSVGIGGITLAGGIGFLVRKHGLTIDNVLAAEIVTADGEIRLVDAKSHPDLFWAIRGGGGNLGVVTRFKLRLHELGEFTGGMLILPATPQIIARFLELAEAAPEELSTIANVMPAPPMPFVPAEHHGRLILMALMAYAGPDEAGKRVLAPFRELAPPIVDMLAPKRYREMFPPEDGDYRPTGVAETMFVDRIDEQVAETICRYLRESDASLRAAQLRVLGGAMARVPADATAFAHRRSRIMVNVAAFYDGPEERPVRQAWVASFAAALRQQDSGRYVGFLSDEPEERVREAYPPATWNRLAGVKHAYDPTNLFRLNQNVPPQPPGRTGNG
jgi:FAD/FMN-containing dehydrogenase